MEVTCICGEKFSVEEDIPYFTTDCPHCNKLLLVEDGIVYDFHKKMHEECPSWPENGEGTGFIEI